MKNFMLTAIPAALGEDWTWTQDPPKGTATATRAGVAYTLDEASARSASPEVAEAIAGALGRAVAHAPGPVELTIRHRAVGAEVVAKCADGVEV